MPRVEYGGQVHEFPDSFTDDDIRTALQSVDTQASSPTPEPSELDREIESLTRKYEGKPLVPRGDIHERDKIIQAEAQATVNRRRRRAAETKVMESRGVGERAADTGAFALSLLPRMISRGEYGASDIAKGLGYEETAKALAGGEQDFAWANRPGLEAAAAFGEVTAGIPFLNTMGGVTGQVMRTGASNLRHPLQGIRQATNDVLDAYTPAAETSRFAYPGAETASQFYRAAKGPELAELVKRLAREEGGSGPIPPFSNMGGAAPPPAGPPAPPPVPPAPQPPPRGGPPTRNDIIATGERLNQALPEGESYNFTPNMVAGNETGRMMAGGLMSIPFAGAPVSGAVERGLFGLGRVREVAADRLGRAGDFEAGSALKNRVTNWIKNSTNEDDILISDMYRQVGDQVRDVPANLQNLRNLRKELLDEKKRTTTRAHDAALGLIDEMLDPRRFPQGMPYSDILEKRKEIGARMSGDITAEAGTSQPTLKRIYAAMTEDMKFALRRGGGARGERAWEEANAAARQVAEERGILEGLIGAQGQIMPERIVQRLRTSSRSRAGNVRLLRLLDRILEPAEMGDLAATIADDLGRSLKNGEFSAQRFTTDYGKMSDAAKDILFKEQRVVFDDLTLIANRWEKLGEKFNRSNTGIVNSMLNLISNPGVLLGGGASMLTMGGAGTAMLSGGGLAAGRRWAHILSRPAVANESTKLFRAVYMASRVGEGIVAREQALTSAIRSYSVALAAETGGDAATIEQNLTQRLNQIRKNERNKS